ncbi:RNA pseudouridylate synthase domain-containing protein 3 [Sarcoptes scabiei]|nr:RNA pseudouridylate synthase domain-containing protein 3 [Sarcoptes scabiei]
MDPNTMFNVDHIGLFVQIDSESDQNSQKISLVDPKILQQTIELNNLIKNFQEKNEDYRKIVANFLTALKEIGEKIEDQKIKAIGSRNQIKALEMEKDALKQQYRNLIREKKIELERLMINWSAIERDESFLSVDRAESYFLIIIIVKEKRGNLSMMIAMLILDLERDHLEPLKRDVSCCCCCSLCR